MTIEHEQLRLERPESLVDAGKFFGHRFSQPNVLPAALDRNAKRRILAVRLCVVALERDAHRLQRDQRLTTARVILINWNLQVRTGKHLQRGDRDLMINALPASWHGALRRCRRIVGFPLAGTQTIATYRDPIRRSEERRVGKECRSRWSPYH